MQLLPTYVTPYCYLASCYDHMGRLGEAREVIERLSILTPPTEDPPVMITQDPERRAFFLAGYQPAIGGSS